MTTTVSPAVLNPGATLSGSPATVITGAVNTQTIIKRGVFTNTTTASVMIEAFRTPSGGSPLALLGPRSLASNASDLAPEMSNMVLNAGDAISAQGAGVFFFASGFTATG